MTPGARVQAAIAIIDRWAADGGDLGRLLAAWGRQNRYAGSGDRRAIADLVHDAIRRRRSAAWVAGADEPASGRELLIGSLILDGNSRDAVSSLFSGARHMPERLSESELDAMGRSLSSAPRGVRLDFPDWLGPHLEEIPDAALDALRSRAPLFLRVNRLRTDVGHAIAALGAEGIVAEPGPRTPDCLRVTSGAQRVSSSAAYRDGLVEIQDASSQAAAEYAMAQPGELVLDYCAGGGGKALALSAAIGGNGEVHAHDISAARLAQLADRAKRAGANIKIHSHGEIDSLAGRCDLVFADVPCSSSGAWRRNPDAKWRLTVEMLEDFVATQRLIVREATRMLRPNGRLVYATCSILRAENETQCIDNQGLTAGRPPLRLMPGDDGDGFFACELLRASP